MRAFFSLLLLFFSVEVKEAIAVRKCIPVKEHPIHPEYIIDYSHCPIDTYEVSP